MDHDKQSLRLTRIYTCQWGMSTRFRGPISYSSIFFNFRSSARFYNLSSALKLRYPGEACSEKLTLWRIAAMLLLSQTSIVKEPVRMCVCSALDRAEMQCGTFTCTRPRDYWRQADCELDALMPVSVSVRALRPLLHSDAAAEKESLMPGLISG